MQQRQCALMALLLVCLLLAPAHAMPPQSGTPATLLARAEQFKTIDHARFAHAMKLLHRQEKQLTPAQKKRLLYLDAWQTAYAGNYAKSVQMLDNIIDHSSDVSTSARARALLIHDKFIQRKYEEAYVLANKLMAGLPKITDPAARMLVLGQIIQMLNRQDQYDLALKYARQMKASFTSGEGKCAANVYETQTLLYAGKLTSTDPAFHKAIKTCLAGKQTVYANALRLDWASLVIDEGHASQAIAFLHKIAPSILKSKYKFHIAALHSTLAQAYLSQGNNDLAKKSAQAALANNDAKSFNWTVQSAYKILYQVEDRAGHVSAALYWYKKYFTQYKAAMKEAKAQALAYQMVQQEVLAKKLKLEKLSKQNKVLHLQQSLDSKAAETSRLYIALLLIVLVFIAFWLYRTKHSQLRFRKMARHDDLTGAYNRQHFFERVQRTLGRLCKSHANACLLVLDMDHFKRVNDTHGHSAGDKVLKHAAAIFRGQLRDSDVFGRLGGEEFGILMACSREQGVVVGERICQALASSPTRLDEQTTITVTASIGLACSDVSGHVLSKLLIDADGALYGSKRSGRNRLTVDDGSGMNAAAKGKSEHVMTG